MRARPDRSSNRQSLPPAGYKLILYDLDGTLIDSFEDIGRALNSALAKSGLPLLSLQKVKSFVGDGADVLLERALGAEHLHRADEVTASFMDFYRARPATTASLYPGVRDTLETIRAMGLAQAVVTNKPHEFAVQSCEGAGLSELLDRIQGASAAVPLKPDPEAALMIMEELSIERSQCLMVGDGSADVKMARAAGIAVAGCTWGSSSREALISLGAGTIIDSIEELLSVITNR